MDRAVTRLDENEFTKGRWRLTVNWRLEQAQRRLPGCVQRFDVIIGVDVAGPGRDRTVACATCGGAILETQAFTDADARGPVLEFIGRFKDHVKVVRVDSSGIGFYFCEHLRSEGYRSVGINVGSASSEPERFRNLKAQRFWHLRERFQRGEVAGLSDEILAELASISYLINARGQTEIEDKASVKAALGHSPDLAEALMLALGELPPEPFAYIPAPARADSLAGFFRAAENSNRLYADGQALADAEDRADVRGRQADRRFNRRQAWP